METEEGDEVAVIDLFFVEDEPCRDLKSAEECSGLESTCGVFAELGYRYCRKTCGLCDSKIQRSNAGNANLETRGVMIPLFTGSESLSIPNG